MIVIYLSKQQPLDANPDAIEKLNFIGNLDQPGIQKCFSLLKKQKKLFWFYRKEMSQYCKFILF